MNDTTTEDVWPALRDPRFRDYHALECNRGCEPVPITRAEFDDLARNCQVAAWAGFADSADPHASGPYVARLADPYVYAISERSGPVEVAVRAVFARDAHGRHWALAAADDEPNKSILDRLNNLSRDMTLTKDQIDDLRTVLAWTIDEMEFQFGAHREGEQPTQEQWEAVCRLSEVGGLLPYDDEVLQ